MGKIITKEFLIQSAIQLFITGGVVFLVQKYYEDYLTSKRLKHETFMSAKKDAYFNALQIAYRQMASTDYDKNALTGNLLPEMKRNKGASLPTEVEINTAYSKLYLYAGDRGIINSFYRIMVNNDSNYTPIYYMRDFLDAITRDLNNPEVNKDFHFAYTSCRHKS